MVFTSVPVWAQPPPCYDATGHVDPNGCEGPGGTRYNGHRTQPAYLAPGFEAAAGVPSDFFPVLAPGFLFEPESPFAPLKQVPTWNELEQLLDNPYVTALCSSLAGQPGLVTGTPGNYDDYPAYCTGPGFTRRESFPPVVLPPLNVHPLNYNPATGEEMRLLSPTYPGGQFTIPDQLYQDLAGDQTGNTWRWTTKGISVTPGSGRVFGPEIDYDGPIAADPFGCISNLELVPPEGTTLCGGDPGEPGYAGFGVFSANAYSTPAIRNVASAATPISSPGQANHRLYDATRGGFINARNPVSGAGGLNKPSLRSEPACNPATSCGTDPNYLINIDPDNTLPSNENDYIGLWPANGVNVNNYRARKEAARHNAQVLGKALFWDMQVGSDSIQSCGTCHFNGTGTDTRTKNQMNPNHIGGDNTFQLMQPNERDLVAADFPLMKLSNTDMAGDPACTTPIVANVDAYFAGLVAPANVPPYVNPVSGDFTVCDAANMISDNNDVVSSMGVHWGRFKDIAPIGIFTPAASGVASVAPDLRTTSADCSGDADCLAGISDPILGFAGTGGTGEPGVNNQFRRVEPRNTPTMQLAGSNFDNFWDGRARHDFNGGSVFGDSDPQTNVWVTSNAQNTTNDSVTATRQIIKFSAIASLATGPGLSEFEMSLQGRNWAKVGKKLLQAGVTPLANQLVDPTDSLLGPYSNQVDATHLTGGSACAGLAAADRSPGTPATGKPGLCISYRGLIRQAFYPALWQNTGSHLTGCYTDKRPEHSANQCAAGSVHVRQLVGGAVPDTEVDPFDGYVLQAPTAGAANATDTNQFTQMEANFSLFWGLSINAWVNILVPDNTPFDQFLDANPDAFMAMGDTTEALLVNDLVNCDAPRVRNSPTRYPNPNDDPGLAMGACFTEVGNFKRDRDVVAHINATAEGGGGATLVPAGGTRTPGSNQPDPLLGLDIFFASNLSLKNPNFRSGRCGACHNMPNLTDNTMPFTFKAILPDFASEFAPTNRGVELLIEPLGRFRIISGFLLESEIAENGQDAVERRFINQSIAPNPTNAIAYPDGVFNPPDYNGSGQAFIDNGVYNLGVRPISEDIGRGGNDAFGWPLSLATLLMKNLGGVDYEPNVPCNPILSPGCDPSVPERGSGNMTTFDPSVGPTGDLFEESAHDQQINPGHTDEPSNPLLPPYLAPFCPGIVVGDTQPELDEPFAGINTLTDVAMLEGFGDVIGAINPQAAKNENLNMDEPELMGTWPVVNRVLRDGAFKAPQLRNVELTGPYFHNGGKLTLRQVVDFYVRGGDFPITNAQHRDFLLTNLNIDAQSNLSEEEKVALVDFLLELTDERNRFDRAPFDHPEVIIPVDGTAPDNTGRTALLADAHFRSVAQVGAAGQGTPEPAFLNVSNERVSGAAAFPGGSAACPVLDPTKSQIVSHYCH